MTYSETLASIRSIKADIEHTNKALQFADNEFEMLRLCNQLEAQETELMITEDYLGRRISKGRR